MAANRIGALAVTSASDANKIIGIVSERDYLTKVALLGKSSKTTPIIQICTHGEANLVTVNEDESVDDCMKKVIDLLSKNFCLHRLSLMSYFCMMTSSAYFDHLEIIILLSKGPFERHSSFTCA